jgi:hypothetical protein
MKHKLNGSSTIGEFTAAVRAANRLSQSQIDQRLAQNATLTLPRLRDSRGRFVSDGGFFVPKWARAEIM